MDPKFQSSFIPKRPVVDSPKAYVPVEKERNIFSILAGIVFVITILISGGLFAYKIILDRQIGDADTALNDARTAFETEKIKDLLTASDRLASINTLLDKHFAVSELMVLLQNLTLKNVRFTSLFFKNKDNVTLLTMDGESANYNALAQQSDILSKSGYVSDIQFSDFVLGTNGNIAFKFQGSISPKLVSYKETMITETILEETQP